MRAPSELSNFYSRTPNRPLTVDRTASSDSYVLLFFFRVVPTRYINDNIAPTFV
jgi:hypothetical protein